MTEPHDIHDGLLHLRAHIAFHLEDVEGGPPVGFLPLGPRSVHRDGSPSLGAIATMVDVVGMRAVGHEGPMVTSHLALRLPGRPVGTQLRSSGRSMRRGRAGGTSLTHVYDEDGTVVGTGTVTGVALAAEGGSHKKRPDGPDDFYVRRPHPTDGPCPEDYIGLEPAGHDAGTYRYRMPFHESLRNINGVLHGGGACLIAEQAARCAAADAGMVGAVFDSLDVHFLAPGLQGPFTALVEVVPDAGERRAFVVEVLDAGRADRRVALGLVGGGLSG